MTTLNRSHQTALFVRLNPNDSANYRARVDRLVESLNGPNIKVDIYSVNELTGEVTPGIVPPTPAEPPVIPSDEELLALAAESGYQQAFINHNTKD